MFDHIIQYIATASIPAFWLLLIAMVNTFTENIFPPAPCDSILIMLGAFVGMGKVDFVSLMIFSTIGSTLGFGLMYWLGKEFGEKILESRKFSFLSMDALEKPRKWFQKYGFIIIVANRFLSGTRAVISFFAGISELPSTKTLILSAISAALWNAILIGIGIAFGHNWQLADKYISIYGNIILIFFVILAIGFGIRWYLKRRKTVAAPVEINN